MLVVPDVMRTVCIPFVSVQGRKSLPFTDIVASFDQSGMCM